MRVYSVCGVGRAKRDHWNLLEQTEPYRYAISSLPTFKVDRLEMFGLFGSSLGLAQKCFACFFPAYGAFF